MLKQAFVIVTLLWASSMLSGQTPTSARENTLSAQERAQGWQLLFDGKTLTGWHVSGAPGGGGRSGPPQPPTPGQVGTPKPCVSTRAASTPPGGSSWEVVDGMLTPC